MSATLKGVLFDLDDTLINWAGVTGDWRAKEARHLNRVYTYLAQQGRALDVSFEAFLDDYMRSTRDAWAESRSTLRAPHLATLLLNALMRHGFKPDGMINIKHCLEQYGWGAIEGVVVFPEVPSVLQTLQDAGIALGIVTNANQPMWLRDMELEEYGLLRYFPVKERRITAADSGFLKPHANIFQRALQSLGTSPEETVFVGDNPIADIAGAQGVGMKAIWRIHRDNIKLLSGIIVPDASINGLEELLTIFDQWYPAWR